MAKDTPVGDELRRGMTRPPVTSSVASTVEDAAVSDELRRGAWMTEDAAAGDELRRGADGGGCGCRRQAPAWDVDGGTTGDDTLVPDS
uniref:DUF834 domain-containing protein n=1 Tax=Oryza nivara TaxID=4536 RepID=A0A0E0HML3_ORYNI